MYINCSNIHYIQNTLFSRHSKAASSAKDDLNAKKAAPPPTGALFVYLFMYLFAGVCIIIHSIYSRLFY